jgi:hypothetical protein
MLGVMCEQCQQLQARVKQLEGVLGLVSERAGWSGKRYEVYEVDMNKLRAALSAPPSPDPRDTDPLVCTRCGGHFHDSDMQEHPEDYWTCPVCHHIEHTACRGPLNVPSPLLEVVRCAAKLRRLEDEYDNAVQMRDWESANNIDLKTATEAFDGAVAALLREPWWGQ